MPLVSDTEVPNFVQQSTVQPMQPETNPGAISVGDVLGKVNNALSILDPVQSLISEVVDTNKRNQWIAGLHESDLSALYSMVTKPSVSAYDPAFNDQFKELAKASPYYAQFPSAFDQVQNEGEFKAAEQTIAGKIADQQTLAAGGVHGLAVGLLTGLLSPAILLPVGEAAQSAKLGVGMLKTAATTSAWAVAGASGSEVLLRATDPTRTNRDSEFAIGSAALLGGIIGGAVHLLHPGEIDAIAGRMAGSETEGAIPAHPPTYYAPPSSEGDSLSAAAVPKFQVAPIEGKFEPAFGVEKIAAQMGPISRVIQGEFPTARGIMAQFSDTGMALEQHGQGMAVSPIGTVEGRGAAHWGEYFMSKKESDKIFENRIDRSVSKKAFNEQAGEVSLGAPSPNSDITDMVNHWRDSLYLPVYKDATELGMKGFDHLTEEDAMKYAPIAYNQNKVVAQYDSFLGILQEHSLEVYNKTFGDSLASLQHKTARYDQTISDVGLNTADEANLRQSLEFQMKALPTQFPTETANAAQELRALEAEKRSLGRSADTRDRRASIQQNIASLNDTHKETLAPFRTAENALKSRFRNLDYTKSQLETKQVGLLRRMESLGNDQLATIGRATTTGQKLLNKLDGLSIDSFKKGLGGFKAQLERTMKVIEKSESKLDELGANSSVEHLVSSDERSSYKAMFPQQVLDDQMQKFDDLISKIDDLENNAQPRLDEAQGTIQESLDLLAARTNAANYRRTLRMEALKERVKKADPEQATKIVDDLKARSLKGQYDLINKIMLAGGKTERDAAGRISKIDFVEQSHRTATDLIKTITGHSKKSGPFSVALERGSFAARTLQIEPDRTWSNGARTMDFMHTDIEEMARRYTRTAASDMEMFRTFGTVNPATEPRTFADGTTGWAAPAMNAFEDEFNAKMAEAGKIADPAAREKANTSLMAAKKSFMIDLKVVSDRTRHMRGQPENPDGWGYRAGTALLSLSTLRLMGMATVNSISDLGRPLMKFGLTNTFRHAFIPMIADFKNFKGSLVEFKYAGAITDLERHGNGISLQDMLGDYQPKTAPERLLQSATNKFGVLNLMDYWNTAMNSITAATAHGTLMQAIDVTQHGSPGRDMDKAVRELAKSGLDSNGVKEILHQLNLPGGSSRTPGGVLMPNTEAWSTSLEGRNALRAWRSAIYSAVANTIILPGLNKPNSVDVNMLAKLAFQFKSFTLATTSKTIVAGIQDARAGHMASVVTGAMSMLALGAYSVYIRGMIIGGKSKADVQAHLDGSEESLHWWADKAVDNSGLLGVFQFAYDAAKQSRNGKLVQTGNPFQDFLGPVPGMFLGQNAPVTNIANSLLHGTPDPNNAKSLHGLMPGQNLWFVKLFNDFTGALDAIDNIGKTK